VIWNAAAGICCCDWFSICRLKPPETAPSFLMRLTHHQVPPLKIDLPTILVLERSRFCLRLPEMTPIQKLKPC
jgi:hypothetical protein